MTNQPPVLFIGHGAPMNATRDNAFTRALRSCGETLKRPRAVLSISAHWETDGSWLQSHPAPQKLNDFFGDHADLQALAYTAPGDPDAAALTLQLVPGAQLDAGRGHDHGTWAVARHLFPRGDVPIYQLSLDRQLSAAQHHALGRRLRVLRELDILIMASGNICHNLRQIDRDPASPALPWNLAFDEAIAAALQQRDESRLIDHAEAFPEWSPLAVPTPEHYTPLLYALGATTAHDRMHFLYEGHEHAAISLRSVVWQ